MHNEFESLKMSTGTQSHAFSYPFRSSRIFVAGHRGMVGRAVVRRLQAVGCTNLVTRTHSELDLTDQVAVRDFFAGEKIDHVILAAARVGGIMANNAYPAEFIYSNLIIQTNVIHQAFKAGVCNLLFLGSSCIYPKFAPQPMKEEYLLTGELEPTNEPYAVAKIAGIKMCEAYNRQYSTNYRSVMPTNLYGPGDNFDLENSHVLPAMIRKYHLAKLAVQGDLDAIAREEKVYGPIPADIRSALGLAADAPVFQTNHSPKVVLWGTGRVFREFLHVDDMAEACLFVMGLDNDSFARAGSSFFNIGPGKDRTIAQTAEIVAEIVGFEGETVFDSNRPDGTPKKLLDTNRINSLGWTPKFSFREGVQDAYNSYLRALS
jgi:GDP-L-fucose synthase